MQNLSSEALNIDISSLSFKDYWGPDKDYVFEQFKSLPFAPFNKLEKIGKVCDFTLQITKPQANQPTNTLNTKTFEEENEFFVVEGKSAPKSKAAAYKKRLPYKAAAPLNTAFETSKKPTQQRPNYNRNYPVKTKFKESVLVKSDWTYIHDIMKTTADKTMMSGLPQSKVLAMTGTIREYDSLYDKTDSRNEKPIPTKDGAWAASLSTTSDNFFLELIEKDSENNLKDPVLYTTDSLLIALMTLKHSNFPWEIIVNKNDNFIMLDKPEKAGQSYIDLITTNENTTSNLPEEEKDVLKLSLEATNANKNFITQVSCGEEYTLGPDNKAIKSDRKLGYVYKRYTMDSKFQVVVRIEVDSYITDPNNEEKKNLCLVRALNENDLANDWRKKLTSNRGAVLSSEMRTNSCKLFKWLCQAHLIETDTIKLGFVSRANQKDHSKHVTLGVDSFALKELATILNFKIKDCWVIIKYLIEYLTKQPNGKFALVKMPFKSQIRIFRIPEEKKEEL